MKAPTSSFQCVAQSALRSTSSNLSISAIAAIIGVLPLFSSGARADTDATLLWLAAGAHGAPCNQTNRCATNLACDPQSVTCLKPARLELNFVTDIDLCSGYDASSIFFEATNVGEIAANENVQVEAYFSETYVDAVCRPATPGVSSSWYVHIFNHNAQLNLSQTQAMPVQLAPGETAELAVTISRPLPPYTYLMNVDATISTASGGFDQNYLSRSTPQVTSSQLEFSCGPTYAICNAL